MKIDQIEVILATLHRVAFESLSEAQTPEMLANAMQACLLGQCNLAPISITVGEKAESWSAGLVATVHGPRVYWSGSDGLQLLTLATLTDLCSSREAFAAHIQWILRLP